MRYDELISLEREAVFLYSIPFSEVRRTLARKKRFSGSSDNRMSKRQSSSFTRDAYDYVRKKKSKIKFK